MSLESEHVSCGFSGCRSLNRLGLPDYPDLQATDIGRDRFVEGRPD